MPGKLELNLLENTLDSLKQALVHYESALDGETREFKYAVLNLSQYIELSFKYIISKINPILIYKGVFTDKKKLENTMSLQESCNFLKHLKYFESINEENEFLEKIDWLRRTCNDAKHHKVELSIDDLNHKISKILSTVDELYDVNGISISEKLDNDLAAPQLSKFYKGIIDKYKHKILIAIIRADELSRVFMSVTKDETSIYSYEDARLDCPHCGYNTFVLMKDSAHEYCYKCTYCDYNDSLVVCGWCSKAFPKEEAKDRLGEVVWCSDQCSLRSKRIKGCD